MALAPQHIIEHTLLPHFFRQTGEFLHAVLNVGIHKDVAVFFV
jgi:hypothetical protein